MATRIDIRIDGDRETIRKLRQKGVDVERELEDAMSAGAELIANGANQKAPEPLVRHEVAESSRGHVEVDVGPPDEKWFWRFLETGAQAHEITGSPIAIRFDEDTLILTGRVGHPGMVARPFLRPAFDSDGPRAEREVGDRLKRVINR